MMDSRTKTHKENVFSFLSVAELNMKCLKELLKYGTRYTM